MTVTVEELMVRSVTTVEESTTVGDARRILRSLRVRHLPVVDSERRLVGILSDRDVLGARCPDSTPVSRIMTATPETVFVETPAYEAAAVMVHHGFGCLPVIDSERRLMGLITATDLLVEAHELLAPPADR